jgi:hypothetical protein
MLKQITYQHIIHNIPLFTSAKNKNFPVMKTQISQNLYPQAGWSAVGCQWSAGPRIFSPSGFRKLHSQLITHQLSFALILY